MITCLHRGRVINRKRTKCASTPWRQLAVKCRAGGGGVRRFLFCLLAFTGLGGAQPRTAPEALGRPESQPRTAPASAIADVRFASQELQNIVVRPGDTLWSISSKYLKDSTKWHELLKYNKLPASDPSLALPGMTLRVPTNLIKEQYRSATLVYYINEVLYRRSGSSDWRDVVDRMSLFKSDTLRTTVDARADVRFHTGEVLNLYPNSIAVLRPPNRQADVELMAGEMRGLRSRVVTASARITPKTKDTEFGAKIKDDLTTLVQVYQGRAEVEAQGKIIDVPAGFASEVKLDMPPSDPVQLPPLPEFEQGGGPELAGAGQGLRLKMEGGLISLKMGKQAAKSELQVQRSAVAAEPSAEVPKVVNVPDKDLHAGDFAKMVSVVNPVQGYHVQIALDQNFLRLLVDKRYDAFDSIDLNELLPPGNYWLRVSYIDLLGFEGKYNAPRQVKLGRATR